MTIIVFQFNDYEVKKMSNYFQPVSASSELKTVTFAIEGAAEFGDYVHSYFTLSDDLTVFQVDQFTTWVNSTPCRSFKNSELAESWLITQIKEIFGKEK